MLYDRWQTAFLGCLCLGEVFFAPMLSAAPVGLTTQPTPVISVNGSQYSYLNTFNVGQTLNISVKLKVAPADIGKKAALYSAVCSDTSCSMIDSNGIWLPWNFPDFQTLVPRITEKILAAEEEISIAQQLKGFEGWGNVHVAYKVNGEDFHVNVQPVTFTSSRGFLLDTGLKTCSDVNNINVIGLDCYDANGNLNPIYLGQDAIYAVKTTSKYTKLDNSGKEFESTDAWTVRPWSCVKDNLSGLWWEVKTADAGATTLHSQDNFYTWYNPDFKDNGGSVGVINGGGSCYGSLCDTKAFVDAVNQQGLCGKNDWRLPTLHELMSLVDNSQFATTANPASINYSYFPNTPAADFWTSTPRAIGSNDSWSIYFYYGSISYGANKNSRFRVRLVRNGQ